MIDSASTMAPDRPRVMQAVLLGAFFAFSSGSALGQQSSGAPSSPSNEADAEQRRVQAKTKYEQGAEAYTAGNFGVAVESFLAADRLAPSAPLSFNIARAQEKLGNVAGALRWYRDYLRRSPSARNAAAVRASIASLSASLAKSGLQQLTVLSNPEGTRVEIDNLPAVTTPWTGELAPGRHHLTFSRAGYLDTQRDIDLSAAEPSDVAVQLQQEARVATDGVSSGANPSSARPAKDAPHGRRLGVLPWVTLGVGAAALGGALAFELSRRSAEDDANHASQVDYQAQLDREQSRQTAARVFLGVGGAFVAAGGVMLLFNAKPQAHLAGAGLMCVPQACAASALGRF